MPDNNNTVQITLAITDDGTIKVIDQTRGKVNDLGATTEAASKKGTSALREMKASWLELAAGVTAGYFTIKKGFDMVSGLVDIVAKNEEIGKRLAFQTEILGYKFQEIKPYVDAFAESIQRTTRFSGDMTKQGLDQMLQYTSNVEEAMKGVQLAMDITTKKKGLDLGSAIQQVGMAMNGNVEILGRWIPQLKDLESKLGANASEAEKWAYTQGILNKMFGGAAQNDLQSYSGQLTQLKNEWDDLKKSMGTTLMPAAENWVLGMKSNFADLSSQLESPFSFLNIIKRAMKDINAIDVGVPIIGAGKLLKNLLQDVPKEEIDAYLNGLLKKTDDVQAAQKKAAEQAAKIPAIGVTPPEKDWIKKWVADFDGVTYALEQLGIKSTAVLSKEATDALGYAEVVKKAFEDKKTSVRDYINALNVAADAMKKLAPEDTAKKREEAWDKNAETIKAISKDEEGWLKKVNKANDELFKMLKEIDKLEVPTHADVGPMEREVNASKEKLIREGLIIPVTTEGGTESIKYNLGGGWQTYTPSWGTPPVEKKEPRTQSEQIYWKWQGENEWKDFKNDAEGGIDVPVMFYGIGSSRKPITEKIREIIGEFGGLEKAMTGMKAEINVAELSLEYNKLDAKLNEIEQAFAQTANMMFMHGYSYQRSSADQESFRQVTEDLTGQMKILQMKMDYERLKTYGGSYQAGTRYVPQTGPYMLHEGEQVITKNQISVAGSTNNFYIKSTSPRETADEILHVLKYDLHTELNDYLKRR